MTSLLVAQVNLAFQTAIFALLAVGFLFMHKRKIKAHAQIMLAAVVLNIVSFMAVMAPQFRNFTAALNVASSSLVMVHGFIGGLTLLLSVWVVGVWLMTPLMNVPAKMRCFGSLNKKLMLAVLTLWLASLILGFLIYAIFHG